MPKYEIVGPPGAPPDWGINYHPHGRLTAPEKRAEKGQIVGDLPRPGALRLLAAGLIRQLEP